MHKSRDIPIIWVKRFLNIVQDIKKTGIIMGVHHEC